MTYHDLCAGLEMYLKQVDSEPTARWAHFRFLGTLRPPTTKDLEYRIWGARAGCSTESQKLLWQRLGESISVSHTVTQRCFDTMVRDTLVGVGVFGDVCGSDTCSYRGFG